MFRYEYVSNHHRNLVLVIIASFSFPTPVSDQKNALWSRCLYTQNSTALVEGLHSASGYMFRVVAQNRFGSSPYSIASGKIRTKYKGAGSLQMHAKWKAAYIGAQKMSLQDILGPQPNNKPIQIDAMPEMKATEELSS